MEADKKDGAAIEGQLVSTGFINIYSSLSVGSQEQKPFITLFVFSFTCLVENITHSSKLRIRCFSFQGAVPTDVDKGASACDAAV